MEEWKNGSEGICSDNGWEISKMVKDNQTTYSRSPVNPMQEKYKENPLSLIRLLKAKTMGKFSKQRKKISCL